MEEKEKNGQTENAAEEKNSASAAKTKQVSEKWPEETIEDLDDYIELHGVHIRQ